MYTINEDHMNYGSWDIRHDGQSFLSFWAIFCPFTPFTPSLKKWKNQLKVSSFYTSIPKTTIICYTVPEIWYVMDVNDKIIWCMVPEIWSTTDRIFFFFIWAIFCPFTPLTAQKIKIEKKRKKCLDISSFYTCAPKIMFRWCTVPEIWCATDGRTDGRTEKVTYRGGCPI